MPHVQSHINVWIGKSTDVRKLVRSYREGAPGRADRINYIVLKLLYMSTVFTAHKTLIITHTYTHTNICMVAESI